MTDPLQVGDVAPDFTLQNVHGEPVTLSSLRGKPVAIVFFPFAFSGICTGELCELRDHIEIFDQAGVTLLAISCDSVFSLKAWADQEGYSFDLLSDFWPHGEVSQAYGVFDEKAGLAVRGTFLLDGDGVVRWSVVNQPGEARDFGAYTAAIAGL